MIFVIDNTVVIKYNKVLKHYLTDNFLFCISGLDPAGPNFSRKPSTSRLDYTDAKFVDVIHTDSNGKIVPIY